MRLNDVLPAIPQIRLALVVLTALRKPNAWVIVVLVGISHTPHATRHAWRVVSRGVALGIVSRDFVVAAEALGEKRSRVIVAEVLPQHDRAAAGRGRSAADLLDHRRRGARLPGLRGRPRAPPTGAQMMYENRLGLATQSWSVLAPVLMIANLTIATT